MKNIRKSYRPKRYRIREGNERSDQPTISKIVFRDDEELEGIRKRIFHASFVLVFFLGVIITRLWFLQIYLGDEFAIKAEDNRVRYVEVTAPRGIILDRRGRELVSNRPSFNVVWTREDSKLSDAMLKKTARFLQLDMLDLLKRIRKADGLPPHIPIRLKEDIDWETVARIENNRFDLPGLSIEVLPVRAYPHANLASHLIGYLGEINQKELSELNERIASVEEEGYTKVAHIGNLGLNRNEKLRPTNSYSQGDQVGKLGLEKTRELQLRGEKGRNYMEVNALGFEQKNLVGLEPLPGHDIQLTMDLDLQSVAEGEMQNANKAGSVVAVEVNTGRLLILASSPSLQIEKFIGGISSTDWNSMLSDPLHPLINKAVQGQYPPASVFKIITALAGLGQGVMNADAEIFCPGFYSLGNRTFRCWKEHGHGPVNLKRALAQSCDVYFYMIGQRLGIDLIADYASRLGLGRRTGIEIEHEKEGLIPTSQWKKNRFNVAWQKGETLNAAIGQGYTLTTPLQLCMMTAAIANGGVLYKPGIVESVTDQNGKSEEKFSPEIVGRLQGQALNLRLIREGLIEAVNGPSGTGQIARLEGITVAGKTGTAQVIGLKRNRDMSEEDIPYEERDHAWFTCFAPAENPRIAVTVMVEHGLHGSSGAAPVAHAVLKRYFELASGNDTI